MKLEQVRPCDSACCKESPRWPDGAGGCKFLDDRGCQITRGVAEPPEVCPVKGGMTGREVYNLTCRDWPQNSPLGRGLGNCCWQWVT